MEFGLNWNLLGWSRPEPEPAGDDESQTSERKADQPISSNSNTSIGILVKRGGSLLQNVFFHEEHPYHDIKYSLALETQKKAFEDLARHLHATNPTLLIHELQLNNDPLSQFAARALDTLFHNPKNLNIREQNAQYLYFLRKALISNPDQNNDFVCQSILHCLCHAKFLQNIMTDYEDEFVKLVIERAEEEQGLYSKHGYQKLYERLEEAIQAKDLAKLANLIDEANRLLEMAPYDLKKSPQALNWQKFTNSVGIFADALATSNTSEVRSCHKISLNGKEREIVYMRHGTVTMEPGFDAALNRLIGQNGVQIIPEYRGFLDSLAAQGKKVLYTNHQDMSKTGVECSRGEKIQTLEMDYKDTFFFLSLPNDGPIVKKMGENTTEKWKSHLVASLVDEKYGFHIPSKLKETPVNKEHWKIKFQEVADEIQKLYFSNIQELDLKQRRVFLPIFYFYVKEAVKAECGIDTIVSVCKDNKDRGNASAGVDELLIEFHCRNKNPNAYYDLFVRTLAPFIIKYEHIVHSRLQVFLDVLRQVHPLTDVQRKAISGSKILTPFQYNSQKFPR